MLDFNWRPGIGDPTLGGWLTVLLYLAAAVTCWRVAQSLRGTFGTPSERTVWLGLAALMLLLGVNKQLDLQSAFTELGRLAAHAQGWYEYRGAVQLGFVFCAGIAGAAGTAALAILLRNAPAATRLALLGAVIVAAFVIIRAASFHHVDRFIGERLLGLKWNWILEMGGIGVIVAAGLLRRRAPTTGADPD